MPWYGILALALSTVTAISVVVGVFFANSRNKYTAITNTNYETTIKSYEDVVKGQNSKISLQADEIRELRQAHNQSMQEIGKLQGELKSYRELPLQQLSENLKVVTQLTTLIAAHLKIDGLDQIHVTNK